MTNSRLRRTARSQLLAMALALPVLARSADLAPGSGSQLPSMADRAYVAAKIYASIQIYFAHFQAVPELDLDAAYRAYLAEALAAPDRRGFSLASKDFMARLGNGHSGFSDDALRNDAGPELGFRADFIEGQWAVTWSGRPDVKAGEIVASLDGVEAEAWFQRQRRYVGASSERDQRSRFFLERCLFPRSCTVRLGDGRQVTVGPTAPRPTSIERKVEGRWLEPKKVAYLAIPGFDDPSFEQAALAKVREFKDARALIVDLRQNGGGSTPGELIAALMERPYRGASDAMPLSLAVPRALDAMYGEKLRRPDAKRDYMSGYITGATELGGDLQVLSPARLERPTNTLFKGRLFVLIDRQVISAAEDFCIPFKDNHRATFVGEATEGSTGQPFLFDFGNGMSFRVGARRDAVPDGSPFGGVAPDVEVPTTLASLRSGHDDVLERALKLARK
jgi:carboxyl-terminal processing protease